MKNASAGTSASDPCYSQAEGIHLCQLWNTLYIGRRRDSDGMENSSHLFKIASFCFTLH